MAPKIKATPIPQRVTVNVTKAKNGYVVSSYNDRGTDTTMIAKTQKEAQGHAAKLLKGR